MLGYYRFLQIRVYIYKCVVYTSIFQCWQVKYKIDCYKGTLDIFWLTFKSSINTAVIYKTWLKQSVPIYILCRGASNLLSIRLLWQITIYVKYLSVSRLRELLKSVLKPILMITAKWVTTVFFYKCFLTIAFERFGSKLDVLANLR